MKKSSVPIPGVRELLALFLCVVLFTGCAGVRPDVGSGAFGPSWQAREAAYLQEEEEDDEFGERMEGAERKSNRKRAWTTVVGVLLLLALIGALAAEEEEDGGEQVTFDEPLAAESSPQTPTSLGFGFVEGSQGQ